MIFVSSTALSLDLQVRLFGALGVPQLLLVAIRVRLGHISAAVRLERKTNVVLVIVSKCLRLVKTLLILHMGLLGVHF